MKSVVPIESITLEPLESLDNDWLRRGDLVLNDHVNRRMRPKTWKPKTGAAME